MLGPYKYLVIALVLGGILAGSHYKAYKAGGASVRAEWQSDKLRAAEALTEAQQKARAAELSMQAATDKLRQEKRDEIARLDRRYRTIVDELRNRAERPATMPDSARDGQITAGCSGAELYREDSEFLARLARDADEIRLALNACYKQYDEVLNGHYYR